MWDVPGIGELRRGRRRGGGGIGTGSFSCSARFLGNGAENVERINERIGNGPIRYLIKRFLNETYLPVKAVPRPVV